MNIWRNKMNFSDNNPAIQILRASEELKHLATCFDTTGNCDMAETLFDLSNIIIDNTKALQKEHMDHINGQYKDAQDFMGNAVNALIESYDV